LRSSFTKKDGYGTAERDDSHVHFAHDDGVKARPHHEVILPLLDQRNPSRQLENELNTHLTP
jgi:hypothetical protein